MKHTILQIKWLWMHAKPVLKYLICSLLITAILSVINIYSALISKSLIDAATSASLRDVFKWLAIIGGIFIFRITLSSISTINSTYCNTTLTNNIQKYTYSKITHSEWLSQNQYHSINLLTRIENDSCVVVGLITSTVANILSLSITFLGSFFTLLYLDKTIAIAAIIIAPIFLLLSMVFGKYVKKIYIEVQDHNIHYNTFVQESIQNLMIVKTFCKEKENMTHLETLQSKTLKLNLRSSILGLIASLFLTISTYLTYFIVFAIGATKLAKGMMTFGTLTALLQLFSNVQRPLSGFASIIPSTIRSLASVERLMEIENLPQEDFSPRKLTLSDQVKPTIQFNHVSFAYKPNMPVLTDVSLTVEPGNIIGLVGPSGCGKTTLIRMLLSLVHAQQGHLSLETDSDEETISVLHRELISYVPQGNTLFSGTILENLRYGNSNATSKDIEVATRCACAWDFITHLESGLDTTLGENGVGISEGQAQRIAIARAFLRQRPILILDEATSSLDPETELKVLHAVKNLPHHPTCFIITHRPSALTICNQVYQFKDNDLTLVQSTKSITQLNII